MRSNHLGTCYDGPSKRYPRGRPYIFGCKRVINPFQLCDTSCPLNWVPLLLLSEEKTTGTHSCGCRASEHQKHDSVCLRAIGWGNQPFSGVRKGPSAASLWQGSAAKSLRRHLADGRGTPEVKTVRAVACAAQIAGKSICWKERFFGAPKTTSQGQLEG